MTRKTLVPLLAIAGLGAHAVPVTAQDSQPGDPDAPPLTATLKAPKALTKKQLKKGFTVTVGCDLACDASFMVTGKKVGIITTKSARVPAGGTTKVKIKVIPLYLKELRKGEKIQVALDARSDANALTRLAKKIRVKG